MNPDQANGLDAKRRAQIVAGLDRMVVSGRMTAVEAERIRTAADPGAFEEALRAVRVRHAREQLGVALDDDQLPQEAADEVLERLGKGEHSSTLRAELRRHGAAKPSTSGTPTVSNERAVRDSPE